MGKPTRYFNAWGANNNTYNQLINYFQDIVSRCSMFPSFNFGPIWDFNATNGSVTFPSIWIEPTDTKIINSIQGVRVHKYVFYIYALDRIDKGDDNYQQILSDMDALLKFIIAEIREGEFARVNYMIIDTQADIEMKVLLEYTDEYTNGWRCKLTLRIPDIYTPCNIPIHPVPEPCVVTYVQQGYVDCGYVE